ncbi:MAG: extracellular solute-binding protein [Butyricicoccus sp.]|nr:extracellular solute-binding protein [Butyricicoccus sp.]
MKIKRLLAALMAATMLFGLAACGGGSDDAASAPAASAPAASGEASAPAEVKKDFTVWTSGSDNVRQMFEMLVEDFNKNSEYAGKFTAKSSHMLSGTGGASYDDSLLAAFQSGQKGTDYDVCEMGADDWSKINSMANIEEMFIKLDESRMPSAAGIAAEVADYPEYLQPYRGTTVLLAYNSDVVTDVPETMDELLAWIKANPGRFTYNVPGTGGAADSFLRTLVYNFLPEEAALSSDEKWIEEWDEGFAVIADIHPYTYKSGGTIVYPNKNQGALDLLAQGEIDMCPMWADMVLSQRKAGTVPSNVKLASITPAFTGSVVGHVIPSFGSNVDGAYAWIDYMGTEAAQKMLVENMAAIPLIDVSNMDMTGYEDLMSIDVTAFRTLSIGDLGTNFNEKWDNEIGILG